MINERRRRQFRLLAMLTLAAWLGDGCATVSGGSGDDVPISDSLADWWRGTRAAVSDFFTDADYREEIQASVRSWFGDFSTGLRAQTIEQMAGMTDEAREIAAWGGQYEALAPYAAWLATRVDYFEAAQAAVASVPETPPVAPPPPSAIPPRRPRIEKPLPRPAPPATTRPPTRRAPPPLPPPRPPRPPRPPAPVLVVKRATEQRRVERASSPAYWRRKVATHEVPARAAALVPRLQSLFREEGLREALVWAAEVESTMNPEARSPAGAVGLFQLMPATARSLGLKTAYPDQRLDPEANARAAARYYKRLQARFGSWPLTLAAYNCGEGRVAKAMKQSGSPDFDAIARQLPLETRMYVPRVLETVKLRAGVALENM